jgi:propanol-preferring alcohol dehydrogenase
MAEYMLIPHPRLLLPLGDLDPREAAPLSDAALTPYHAIKRSLHLLAPGSTAVVIGIGGLGHMAVQILRALCPAQVIAVDTSAEKLRLARDVGADETVEPDDGAAEAILELAGTSRVELVVDNVGADETIALAAAVAGFESHVTVVGLAGGKFEFTFGAEPFEAQLTIPYWGTAIELIEVLDLARAGKIRAHTERFSLGEAGEAYRRLREGTLDGRAVICPHG